MQCKLPTWCGLKDTDYKKPRKESIPGKPVCVHRSVEREVKFDHRFCGDATVAYLKRGIPRWVRQFSASMIYILSTPHQFRPYSSERENGDSTLVSPAFLRRIFFINWISLFFWTDVSGAVLNARFYAVNSTRIPPEINERAALIRESLFQTHLFHLTKLTTLF